MAELITWCRMFRVGPVCPKPCDDCRRTSRQIAVHGVDISLARAHADLGITSTEGELNVDAPTPAPEALQPCNGADDPRERCGRHHFTENGAVGGYACCCGAAWAFDRCRTGAADGEPVAAAVGPNEFDRYVVASHSDVWLTCPHDGCETPEVHESEPRPSDQVLTLGDLIDLALDHEGEQHGGYRPLSCEVVDAPGGHVAVMADQPLTEEDQAALGELVEATRARGIDPDGPLTQILDHDLALTVSDRPGVGARIRAAREQLGWTQTELGNRTGYTQATALPHRRVHPQLRRLTASPAPWRNDHVHHQAVRSRPRCRRARRDQLQRHPGRHQAEARQLRGRRERGPVPVRTGGQVPD
ncbi:hypothetical protein GCM10009555_018020 [Acrocarpospora macrocephala]|uniref:HTH cro/C1-type domain-containing protein n=1 Tax=Acrocarpospora macrocephala TaxID=150177 RepID=A0A5M3WH58_9ACTN|nr:helix-turn-helix transcriptional regulator [Acrocarpospora macrocephala]GES07462.1 hypothetical protein Amac_010570 [Acrocarpospora macrocephala]